MEHAADAGPNPKQHDYASHRRATTHNGWGGDWAKSDNKHWDVGCVMSNDNDNDNEMTCSRYF